MTPPLWRRYLRFWRNDVDADVEDEVRFHLDMRRLDFEARGLHADDAQRAAAARFGDIERISESLRNHDRRRERRRLRSEAVQDFVNDVRYALRGFARAPGFTAVAVLTLALGIGATTAIFSVVNAVLLRPLPYTEPEQLVNVWMDNRRMSMREDIHSRANFEDLRARNRSLVELAGFTGGGANLTGGCAESECEPRRISMSATTGPLWRVLGVSPVLGRTFGEAEETPGSDAVVVLSHALWTQQFGGDSAIVGRNIRLNGRERAVIGVMPPSFRFPNTATQAWIPLAQSAEDRQQRSSFFLYAIGRLRPGVSLDAARAELAGIARQLEEEYPDNRDLGTHVVPLEEQAVGRAMRTALWVMLAAVGAVLLIAAANVANLVLSRAAVREREIGVRLALGAGRRRLVRQLLTESLCLAALGAAGGLALAWAGLRVLIAMAPADVPRLDGVALDGTVLGVTFAVTLLTGLAFGLAPALQTSGFNLTLSLREGGRGGTASRGGQRLRRSLVGAQVAIVVVLLAASGLLIRSFLALQATDLGFRPDHLLTAQVSLPAARYEENASRITFFNRVFERLRTNPEVVDVAAIRDIFLSTTPNSTVFTIEGRERTDDIANMEVPLDPVTPDYFAVMGIRLVAGRTFTELDGPDATPVAIINENMARRYWPEGDALGKRFRYGYGGPDSAAQWLTIVGIVADMRRTGFDAPVRYETFYPFAQGPAFRMQIVLRTRGEPTNVARALREAVREADADQPVYGVGSMETRLGEMMTARRFAMILLGTFAGLALVLGVVGVYGVTSYLVAQRVREMGVRMALGASGQSVISLVVRQGMKAAAVGLIAGLAGALLATRLLGSLLYGVSPRDVVTFTVVAVALFLATLLANWIPARRAARIDPLVALRAE
jgi:putative ABC transport system permease protein